MMMMMMMMMMTMMMMMLVFEQLLVNRTLYEKSLASGFGTVHFVVDASEEQQVSIGGCAVQGCGGRHHQSRDDIFLRP